MGGTTVGSVVKALFAAIDGEAIEQQARALAGVPPAADPGDTAREKAQQQLVAAARAPLTGAVVTQIVAFCAENMQTIDHDTQDKLLHAGWDADAQTRATAFVADFETFCAEHRDRLDALPANARPLTELTALVALLRRACGLDRKLTPFADTVRRHYRDWILRANAGNPFNAQQTAWLELIRDHVIDSLRMEKSDLDYAPFDARGGLGRMHELFGERLDALIDELNKELTA